MAPAFDYSRVAPLYDSYVRFTDDVPFFLQEFRGVRYPVLELTSGTGRVSLPLLEAGVDLTCVDSSLAMLAILRGKLAARRLAAPLLMQDMALLGLRSRFGAAFIPFHAFHEILAPEDRLAAVTGIATSLVPGGRFICTLHNPAARLRSMGRGRTSVGRFPLTGETGEVALFADLSYEAVTATVSGVQLIQVYGPASELRQELEIPLRFALFEIDGFLELLAATGFETETVYGDYSRSSFSAEESPFAIVCARQR